MAFEVYDRKTGKPVTEDEKSEITKNTGLKGKTRLKFAVTEDGDIILIDRNAYPMTCSPKMFVIKHKDKTYPDIRYLEELLLNNIINQNPELGERKVICQTDTSMFSQTWASTAGGFERPGMFAGAAMTTEYTTVIKAMYSILDEHKEKVFYGVFFGNRPAYLVENPTDEFFTDLEKKRMKSAYDARKAY